MSFCSEVPEMLRSKRHKKLFYHVPICQVDALVEQNVEQKMMIVLCIFKELKILYHLTNAMAK